MGNWIDKNFEAPVALEMAEFRLRMLTVNDLVKDYDAVMMSRDDIVGVFGPDDDWPRQDLSLEQDLIDLGWHQKEFQNGTSFAYTVVSLDESQCLGCVYINPTECREADAMVILWSRSNSGIESALYETVRNWIDFDWPFRHVVYPGRELSWQDWIVKSTENSSG